MINRQLLVDRLLETENLTDNLEDDDADQLLKWGVAHVDALIENISSDEAVGDQVNQLMSIMRGVNSLSGDPASATREAVSDLANRFQQLFGVGGKIDEAGHEALSAQLLNMSPHDAFVNLLKWLDENYRFPSEER